MIKIIYFILDVGNHFEGKEPGFQFAAVENLAVDGKLHQEE